MSNQELVSAFLSLPWRLQVDVMNSVGLISGDDRNLSDQQVIAVAFKRAAERGLVDKLREETELAAKKVQQ